MACLSCCTGMCYTETLRYLSIDVERIQCTWLVQLCNASGIAKSVYSSVTGKYARLQIAFLDYVNCAWFFSILVKEELKAVVS